MKGATRYHQIAEYYRSQIESQAMTAGKKMPTEEQICDLFQVSRITARQAMSELVQSGHIERIQGKGSFVRAIKMDMQLNHLQGFTEEMRAKGMSAFSHVLSVAVEPVDDVIAKHLDLSEGAQVISIKRVRYANGEPMAVEYVYLPFHICPDLVNREHSGSLYSLLEEYGITVAKAKQDITAGFSPRAVCDLLEIKPAVPTLLIERTTYLENGSPLEYVRSMYRSDRYSFHVEMSR